MSRGLFDHFVHELESRKADQIGVSAKNNIWHSRIVRPESHGERVADTVETLIIIRGEAID